MLHSTHRRCSGPGSLFYVGGESPMTDDWHEHKPRRRRPRKRKHGHRRRERSRVSEAYEEIDDAMLSPEERALRNARRAADEKVKLAGTYGLLVLIQKSKGKRG